MSHAFLVRSVRAATRSSCAIVSLALSYSTAGLATQAAPTTLDNRSRTVLLRKTSQVPPVKVNKGHAQRNTRRPSGRPSPRSPAIELPDFAALPRLQERKVVFRRIDMETQLGPIFTRPNLPTFRGNLFMIRAAPVKSISPAKPHPFPATTSEKDVLGTKRVVFGVITTKAAVSKLASERQRCRTRFKAAVEAVVNRNVLGENEAPLVNDNYVYVTNLKREVYEADFGRLVHEVGRGFKALQAMMRETPSTMRPRR